MSRRPPPVSSPVVGSGVFKNLFDTRPEFPLKDGHPPQRRPPSPVGAPFSVQAVRSFELVATFDPYDQIPDAEQALLKGGSSASAQGPQAYQGPMTIDPELQDLLQQTLTGSTGPPVFADSAAVLRIRVRRIPDTGDRIEMARVIRAFVEAKVAPDLGPMWSKIRYAYREVESTCSPILSEYLMMWCSTDQESSDKFTDLILDIPKPAYENPVEAFFRVLFGDLNTFVDIGNSDEATTYKSVVSRQTKWELSRSFVRSVTLPNGRVRRESLPAVEVFAAREFTAQQGQAASGQRRRLA